MFEISPLHVLETEARRLWFYHQARARIPRQLGQELSRRRCGSALSAWGTWRGAPRSRRPDGATASASRCRRFPASRPSRFARALEAEYVHTPFGVIDHTPEGQEGWARRWEEFLGFERLFSPGIFVHARRLRPMAFRTGSPRRVHGAEVPAVLWFTRRYPDAFLAVAPELRANLRLQPGRRKHFASRFMCAVET